MRLLYRTTHADPVLENQSRKLRNNNVIRSAKPPNNTSSCSHCLSIADIVDLRSLRDRSHASKSAGLEKSRAIAPPSTRFLAQAAGFRTKPAPMPPLPEGPAVLGRQFLVVSLAPQPRPNMYSMDPTTYQPWSADGPHWYQV